MSKNDTRLLEPNYYVSDVEGIEHVIVEIGLNRV